MRHLYGIALAVMLSAAVFFGGGWGFHKLHSSVPNATATALPAGGGSLIHATWLLLALGALAGTALLAGLLIIIPRVSPLAAGLPGLGLIAWTVLYAVSVARAVHYIPMKTHAFGAGFEAMGISGVLGAAGIVLVMPLFVPSRWSARPADDDYDEEEEEAIEATTVTTPSRSGGLLAGSGSSAWKTISEEATRPVSRPGDPEPW
jgi:hypothetical protein